VLVLLATASGSAYLTRHCLAVANTTIQKELGFNNEQMGLILGAFSLGYLFCQVPGGWLGNRNGTRGALSILSVLWSAFTVWTAAVSGLITMVASRFAFGLAQAGLVPNSAKVVKDWFPLRRRGIVSAVIAASMSIGGALAMELMAILMDDFHWRIVFRMYSLVGVVWAMAFYLFFRNRPEQHPWVNEAELKLIRLETTKKPRRKHKGAAERRQDADEPDHDEPKQAVSSVDSSSNAIPFGDLLRSGNLWAICIQSFFLAAGYNLFVTFFPAFLEFAYGVSRKEAGTYTKWPLLGVIVGGLMGGLLVDFLLRRTGNKWLSRSGVAVGALGVTGLLTLKSSWTTTAGGLVTVISIGALFSGMSGPAAWAATIDVSGRQTTVLVGIMNMAGCLSGVVVTPLLGRLIDFIKETNGNWNLVIELHAAFYLAGAVAWLFVNPNKVVIREEREGVKERKRCREGVFFSPSLHQSVSGTTKNLLR